MTLFLTTGQAMRAAASHIKEQRRYFATSRGSRFPTIDTTLWDGAPSQTSYDPDGLAAPWHEITELVDDGATKLRMWDEGPVSKWQAELSGWQFNSSYIGHDQGVLCLRRLWPDVENADGWSNWRVWFLGYVKQDTLTHDYTGAKAWRAVVEGVSQYADKTRLRSVVTGRTDLARGQAVRTSPLLDDMKLEANRGEFLGLPANSGQNLVDEDEAVPCIWANEPTPEPERFTSDNQSGAKLKINEVYLRPPVGYGDGYQWFEVVNTHSTQPQDLARIDVQVYDSTGGPSKNISMGGFSSSKGTGWTPSGAGLAQDMDGSGGANSLKTVSVTGGSQLQGRSSIRIDNEEMALASYTPGTMTVRRPNNDGRYTHAAGASIDVPGEVQTATPTNMPPRSFIILCQNRRRFDELFEAAPGALVFDWSDQEGSLALDPTAGKIVILEDGNEMDTIYWGDADQAIDEADGDGIVNYTPPVGGPDRTVWYGARIPTPAIGFSFKRRFAGGGVGGPGDWDSQTAADFIVEDVPTPGRRQAAIGTDGKRIVADTAWFSIALPALTCELAEDLNDGDTVCHVNNTDGFYTTGSALIVATIVAYSAKTSATLTLASAWAGGNVPAGTRLYPVDGQGVAHDSWPVSLVEWSRKQEPAPAIYTIYTSALATPIYPDDGAWATDWWEDWQQVTVAQHTQTDNVTADLVNGDEVIYLSDTTYWPSAGTLYLKHRLYNTAGVAGEQVVDAVRFIAKTNNTVRLAAPWLGGLAKAYESTASAILSPGLTRQHGIAPARRARHVLMIIDAMTDLGRGKLNRFSVYPDLSATADPDRQVDGTDVSDFVRFLLVEQFGLPAAKFSSISHAVLPAVSTRETSLTGVLRDAAESTASHLRWTLAEGARWRPVPELGTITNDDERWDWTFTGSDYTLLTAPRGERNTVAQVRLRYRVSGTRDARMVIYPNTTEAAQMGVSPDRGAIYTVPKLLTVPTDAAAIKIARYEYNKRAYPVRITFTLPFPATDWLHPLAVVKMEPQADATTEQLANPTLWGKYKVVSIDEYRTGQFPNVAPRCDVTVERLGVS